jgi:hypothetical protein
MVSATERSGGEQVVALVLPQDRPNAAREEDEQRAPEEAETRADDDPR